MVFGKRVTLNDYFSSLGAKIISSEAAKKDHKARSSSQWSMLESRIGEKGINGTKEKYADILFKDDYKFTFFDYRRGRTP